jgi:hypothetical protein
MNPSKKTQEMDALLKEYELVELEIDNHLQNMSTMGSLFVTALVILIGFIIKDTVYRSLLLIIPFFLCITYVYLLNHQRTVIFDMAYANQIEDKINALLGDSNVQNKTIYFGHMSLPMGKARSGMEWVVIIVTILLYFGSLYAYRYDPTIIMVLYCISLSPLTLYTISIGYLLKEWSEELEKQFKETQSERKELDISKLGTWYLFNKKLSYIYNWYKQKIGSRKLE